MRSRYTCIGPSTVRGRMNEPRPSPLLCPAFTLCRADGVQCPPTSIHSALSSKRICQKSNICRFSLPRVGPFREARGAHMNRWDGCTPDGGVLFPYPCGTISRDVQLRMAFCRLSAAPQSSRELRRGNPCSSRYSEFQRTVVLRGTDRAISIH